MRVIFLGEIVGKGGLLAVKSLTSSLKAKYDASFVVAGGSAVTKGFGLGKGHALQLRKIGIDVLIGSEMILLKPDLVQDLSHIPFVLRPANFPIKTTPGRGFAYYKNKDHQEQVLGVLCLQGQAGSHRSLPNNPFAHAHDLIDKLKQKTKNIVVCYHAQTTAEKQAMAHHLSGYCSAVIGYGTRVLTSDLKIINHTACLTDIGYVGSALSIGGLGIKEETDKILSQRPLRSIEGPIEELYLTGCIIDINEEGQSTSISPLRESITNLAS